MLEIAIVLCSVFLVALSCIAADQKQETQKVSASEVTTTASEDDFVLEIYGNANEDDCIDMRDYTYTARIICWLEDETDLADANYDGRISVADMTQIGLIILGRESELTFIDDLENINTIKKPIERIIVMNTPLGEAIQILKATDRVVGVGQHIPDRKVAFPELSKLPCVGSIPEPDFEMILSLNPDAVLMYGAYGDESQYYLYKDHLPDSIAVIYSSIYDVLSTREDLEKLGYILDRRDEAEEFIDWYRGYIDTIKSRTEGLSEDEKPQVYFSFGGSKYLYLTKTKEVMLEMAGGINIAADLEGRQPAVAPEWLIEQNPDVIVAGTWELFSIPSGYESDDLSVMEEIRDNIINRPELVRINAVESDMVYIVHREIIQGPCMFIGGAYYAKWIHPKLFDDLDPQAIHQEYLDRFRRIDFNIYEHGVFVYPPLEES